MENDPRAILDRNAMSRFQWLVVAIMVGLNALDGFDVLSISFAGPGITREWGISPASLGLVLSMELIGMSAGSLILGGFADRVGRRSTILTCLCIMTMGMMGAASAASITALCVWRVVTGIGIGGMLAATNAAVAEVANQARRNLAVILMAGGYPVGAIIGGSITAALLTRYSWHSIFIFGAALTCAFIPLVILFVPESISFLTSRQRPAALQRINLTLRKMGHEAVRSLPNAIEQSRPVPLLLLFGSGYRSRTILLTLAYFAHVTTFYFVLKWVPKIVVDLGFAPSTAAGVLVWANVGGALGSITLGLATSRLRLLPLTIGAMLTATALVVWFGSGATTLLILSVMAGVTGFFTNAGVVGLYAIIARAFDTEVRASATGFVIGVGRGGSALAPALAGLLFATGHGLQAVAILMALGSLAAALALAALATVGRDRANLRAA